MSEEKDDARPDDDSRKASPDVTSDGGPAEAAPAAGGGEVNLGVFVDEARQVITNPAGFYRNMEHSGGFQRPLIFVVVMALALAIVLTALSFVGLGQLGAMAVGISTLLTMPLAALVGSFVGAAIMFVIWKLMGAETDYETAYRCVAYACAIFPITGLIGVVPYLGSIAGIGWGMYLMAVASAEVHGLKQQNAYTVFGILGAILILVNINGERQARLMREQFEGFGQSLEGIEDMSPEEAGQAIGEFLRGLEEGIDRPEQTD